MLSRRTDSKRLLVLLVLLTFALGTAPIPASAQTDNPFRNIAIPVSVTDAAGNTATATGTFAIDRFTSVGDQLLAVGTLTVNGASNLLAIPVAATGTCEILTLELGPLHLDLLGLVVDLSIVNLDITAERGPGKLLGNLLCAIAGLLDNGNTAALANLLNRLLAVLG